jgi:hypothetical protein
VAGLFGLTTDAVGYTYDANSAGYYANDDATIGNNVTGLSLPVAETYGQYNSSLPTITSGKYTSLQTDVNGRLIVTGTLTASLPYSSSVGSQAPTAKSFVGVGGFDGTDFEPLMMTSSGVVSTELCDARGANGGNCSVPFAATVSSGVASAYFAQPVGSFNYQQDAGGPNWMPVRNASYGNNVGATSLPLAVSYGQYNTTAPAVSAGNYGAEQMSASGERYVAPDPLNTAAATLSTVAAANASTLILAAGTAKDRWSVCNESSSIMYLAEAASASATAYTWAFPAQGTVATCMTDEGIGLYTGPLYAFWASATGNARISVR